MQSLLFGEVGREILQQEVALGGFCPGPGCSKPD